MFDSRSRLLKRSKRARYKYNMIEISISYLGVTRTVNHC